ncbi:MAG: hypothetical protein K1X66_04180 [Verrucomicrobiae bacterium]|nr:hypothetical protein [Verrucomicrobiae bacterium]
MTWEFRGSCAYNSQTENRDEPKGNVTLNVNGESYQIISRAKGYYRELDPKEFSDYGLPSNTLIAAKSWHAGFGNLLFVMRHSNQLEVYRQDMNESKDNEYPVEKVSTIPI